MEPALLGDLLRMMMTVLLALASILTVVLGATIAFVVGWNVRQDNHVKELMRDLYEMRGRFTELEGQCIENFPELFKKYEQFLEKRAETKKMETAKP